MLQRLKQKKNKGKEEEHCAAKPDNKAVERRKKRPEVGNTVPVVAQPSLIDKDVKTAGDSASHAL